MIVIGLTGPAGCGKDTAGEILKTNHGFMTTALAFPIKLMLSTICGGTLENWQDREWKESPHPALSGKSPRYAAQTLGTEWGRDQMDKNFWINLCLERLHEDLTPLVAITDVRFDNEAQAIRNRGGYIVKIVRDVNEHSITSRHASEAGVNQALVDVTIQNNGTIQNLADKLDSAFGAMQA